jgi:peptidyl-prolyl cis-trans isomerase SurA
MNRLLVALVFSALAGACNTTPPPPPPPSADAWAVVGGREIKQAEVDKAFRRNPQAAAQTLNEDELLTAKLGLLNEMIVQELLLAKARELKIELPDTELDKAFDDAKKNITPEQFELELKKRDLTPGDMKEGLRRDLLAQKVIEREVIAKVVVSDQEVTDFFNANKAQFNRPEEGYRVAQIVVTPVREPEITNQSGDDATTPQEAAAKTQMLMERLKAGIAFSELAATFSEDPQTAPRGGDLGFVPMSALNKAPPALRDAVLKTTPGSVRVVSNSGAHTIVLVIGHDTAGQKDLTVPAVKEGITATLRDRREQLLRAAYMGALRNETPVTNLLARKVVDAKGKMPAAAAKPAAAK